MSRVRRPATTADSPGERLFELSHDMLGVFGTDGRFVRVNPAFERMLGQPSAALAERSIFEFVHPEDHAVTAAALASLGTGAAPSAVENRWRCADGAFRCFSWLTSSAASIPSATGDARDVCYAIGRDVTERRLHDERLHFQATLLDAVGQAIIATDLAGTVTYWGRAAETLFGWPAAEALGRSIVEVTAAEPSRAEAEAIMAALRDGRSWSGEFLLCRRDGSEFTGLVVDTPVRDASGTLVGIIGATVDMTEQRRMADALRASEARYRAVLAQASDPIYVLDSESRFVLANDAFCALVGYTRQQLEAMRIGDFLGPADRALVPQQIAQLRHGALLRLELPLRRSDGSFASVEVSTRMLDDGTFQGIARDITERRRAEAELRASQARLQLALDAASMQVWERDLSTDRLTHGARPDYGSFVAAVHPDDRERVMAVVEAAVASGGRFSVEYRLPAAGGDVRWYHATGNVIVGEHGAPARLIGVTVDVTARVALEAQLRQAQKMEAVGRLAGGVAHDFNNLLQVITGSTLFARDGLPADSAARAELAEIDAAAARAAALTRQLLAFGRQQVLRPELASVNQVVGGVERMLRRLISADVTLVSDLEPDLPPVSADVGQLEQVLLNLAVNACDAMPDGGTLTIQTRAVRVDGSAAAGGTGLPPGAYVAVRVRDTGVGMDESTRARLFEPFYTTKPLGKGTGLGLATVYGIVMQSGGHVQVDSAPGAGSTFTVLLPTADDVPAPDPSPRREPPPHGRETLLVVEDEPTVRGVVRRMLELGGYTVLEARDGAEALAILTTHAPAIDLVVSDIVMPQMSAGALLAQLGDRARPPRVLLMSGYSRESVTQRPGIAPDVELLAKPFTPDALLRRVRAALDAPHPPGRLTTV